MSVDDLSPTGKSSVGRSATSVGRCSGGAVHGHRSQAHRDCEGRRHGHGRGRVQGAELFGGGAGGGGLRGLGLSLMQACDRVGELGELLREQEQLPQLGR